MYYWNILHMGENELVRKVFNIQKVYSCKNDWVIQIKEDLEMCNIELSEEEIRNMRKYSFRRLVNKKVKEAATKYLMNLKKKHSKCDEINFSSGMKEYLKSSIISTEEKRMLFAMKTRMVDVKSNYRNKYKHDLSCTLCRENCVESEEHLLKCRELKFEPEISEDISEVEYEDIFGNITNR